MLKVFIVSDFTGETAEHVARAAASQFGADSTAFTRHRYVNTKERVEEVVGHARDSQAVIVCTLVDHALRKMIGELSQERGVPLVDILGPLLRAFEDRLGRSPFETPGLLRRMDEEYFKRVKAIEFAIRCDDGRGAEMLPSAEVVVIGISRTSKTPLSMYLAHRGFLAANVPLVPEATPPEELFQVNPAKVVGLYIMPEKLVQIRRERLRILGLDADGSSYARWDRVDEELRFARDVFRRVGCRTYDVTNRAIEETAQEVLDFLRA